jgi:hypothetical protein
LAQVFSQAPTRFRYLLITEVIRKALPWSTGPVLAGGSERVPIVSYGTV